MVRNARTLPKVLIFVEDPASGTASPWDGVITASESAVVDTPEYFIDTNFVTGDSPVTLDLNTALGRNAISALIINDGAGSFTFQLSTDGSTFGDSITLKGGEFREYAGISIDSIRITWVADSAYRVEAI